jgi:peptide-methionine (S)-S-oxide reductase
MKIFIVHIILISLFVIGCTVSDSAMKEGHDEMMKSEDNMMIESDDKMMKSEDNMMKESEDKMMKSEDNMMKSEDAMMKSESDQGKFAKATFAGGCFWCMEPPFDKLEGVISTTSGYTGGQKENPTYEEVSAGGTGHAESVQVVYDPTKVSYEDLLNVFWKNIDPTVKDQQFCDHGNQYRTAIFYYSDEQKQLAEASKEKVAERFDNVYTEIVPASTFYPAEEYHQDYYQKNPLRYKFYRTTCGRDSRLEKLWRK